MTKTTLPKKIWLAGLGALSRAEQEGDAWLEDLMAEGERYEHEKSDEISSALRDLNEKVKSGRGRIRQGLSNIEQTFEAKVSATLAKVGLVSKSELDELQQRLKELETELTQKHVDSDS